MTITNHDLARELKCDLGTVNAWLDELIDLDGESAVVVSRQPTATDPIVTVTERAAKSVRLGLRYANETEE